MATKNIKMDEGTAKKLYPGATPEFKIMLEETFTKEFFMPKIQDRIKDFSNILEELGVEIRDICPWPVTTKATKVKKSQNAFAKIQAITEVYNGGKEEDWADWADTNQPKYFIYWERKKSGWVFGGVLDYRYLAGAGSGYYFKNADHARDAADKFKDIFIEYLPG